MSLAVTTTATSAWNVAKRNYVAAIGGLALTTVALVGAVSLNNSNSGANPGRPSAPMTANVKALVPALPAMTYYIVGSEEQLQAVQAEANWRVEDNAVYAPKDTWKFSILLARTPAEAADASDIVAAAKASWRAAGASGLEVIDLRGR